MPKKSDATKNNSNKLHAGHIEVCVALLLDFRVYTIVPNVHWGLGLRHECDMLALDKKGRFTEIEIKLTASDLKADFKKSHGHRSQIISRLFYAMPLHLCEKYQDMIPKNCGIIAIKENIKKGKRLRKSAGNWKAEFFRHAKHDKTKPLPDEKTVRKFMHLGCMRIWSLKVHNNR